MGIQAGWQKKRQVVWSRKLQPASERLLKAKKKRLDQDAGPTLLDPDIYRNYNN